MDAVVLLQFRQRCRSASRNPLICQRLLPSTTRRFPVAWPPPTPTPVTVAIAGVVRGVRPDAPPAVGCCDADDAPVLGWLSLRSFYGRPAYTATVEIGVYVDPRRGEESRGTLLAPCTCGRAGARDSHAAGLRVRPQRAVDRALRRGRIRRMGKAPAGGGTGRRRARPGDPRTASRMNGVALPSPFTIRPPSRATCRLSTRMIAALAEYEKLRTCGARRGAACATRCSASVRRPRS